MVIFGALHVVALLLGGVLFYMFLRSDPTTRGSRPRTTRAVAAAATTGARRGPSRGPPAACRCPTRSSPRAACAATARCATAAARARRRPAHPPTPVAPARPARLNAAAPRARRPRRGARRRPELLRARERAPHVAPRRLALPRPVAQQPLLVHRRLRTRVAALPRRVDAELVQRPVGRAAEPRLGRVDAEVEADEGALRRPGALLLDRPVAVGLGAELRHGDRLVRVAGAHGVQVAATAARGRRSSRPGRDTSRSSR